MASLEIKILASILWVFVGFHLSFGKGSPKNITAVNVTRNCIISLNLSWSNPATQWTINNYIIYYETTANSSAAKTADNETFYLLSNLEPQTTYNISISTNISYGNGTYQEWPQSGYLEIGTANANNCRLPISNGGSNTQDDTMYVVKLVAIILGSSIGLILISFGIFRACGVCAERNYDKRDMARRESKLQQLGRLADTEIPISADNFFDHVSAMKFSDNRGFKNEFTKLDVPRTIGCSIGNRPYNNLKNRFASVPTYDKTRVTLEENSSKLGSDYINANYVEGLDGTKSYIATQAPLPETVNDFWRMIWEKEIYAVVMIVHLHERGSPTCAKYWPEESDRNYDKITVKALDIAQYPDYVIRTFELKCKDSFELRVVRHFQYTSWPVGREIPIHPTSFVEFVQKVSTFRVNNRQPLVVHCSSGCGRTGVFIVLDNQLERIEQQGDINVFFNVNIARDQRFQIVKTLDEYIFIHDCILEYITFKSRVDVNIRNILDYVTKNKETDSTTGNSGFQTEFRELSRGMTELNNTSEVGALSLNARKNRFEKILPYDHTRVTLNKDGVAADQTDGSDYINASYISSTKRKRGFIVTQNPMEATIFDFWCMVWENKSLAIVTLSILNTEDAIPYWPKENQVLKAGKLNIRLVSIEEFKSFKIRHLEISHTEVEDSRLVRQYQYNTWPDNSNEESLGSFVDFILQCKQWNHVSKSKMLTVHCRAGTGKSGVFVAISKLIDCACEENTFNVFNTVRKLRQQRTAMVQTQEQYELIYFALAQYYKSRFPKRNDKDAGTQTEENLVIDGSTLSNISANNESVSE